MVSYCFSHAFLQAFALLVGTGVVESFLLHTRYIS